MLIYLFIFVIWYYFFGLKMHCRCIHYVINEFFIVEGICRRARSKRIAMQGIGQHMWWACGASAEGDSGWVRGNLRQCDWSRVPSAFIVLRILVRWFMSCSKWRPVDPDGKDTFSKGMASVREQEGTCHKKKGCDEGAARRRQASYNKGIPKLQHDDHPWRSPNVSTHTSGDFIGSLCRVYPVCRRPRACAW